MMELVQGYRDKREVYMHSRYASKIAEAEQLMCHNEFKAAEIVMDSLPSREELIEELNLKLKDKPFMQSMRKVMAGEEDNEYAKLKALSSMVTHIAIECEQGRDEYRFLLRNALAGLLESDLVKKIVSEV